MSPLGRYVRARLHRRIFVWFGASILVTGLVVAGAAALVGQSGFARWRHDVERLQKFTGGRFSLVWDAPETRDELARALADELELGVVLSDTGGRRIAAFGEPCDKPDATVSVTRAGKAAGRVGVCWERHRLYNPWRMVLTLLVAGAVLWAASGRIARRLARPLSEVARVAQEIGAGKLSARVRLGRHQAGEVGVLADAINEMASRIERQLADQRELLAAVSHELRTPLARVRVLAELLRDGAQDPRRIDEMEREIVEIDALVGELLASSRLDFAALSLQPLDAGEVGRRALERAGLDAGLLALDAQPPPKVRGDPTLVARALANLIDNARKHGGGLTALRVSVRGDRVAFAAEDAGPGLPPGEEGRVFEPFRSASGLGLGLALVKRIAEAHGGRAYAETLSGRGARVGIELPRPS